MLLQSKGDLGQDSKLLQYHHLTLLQWCFMYQRTYVPQKKSMMWNCKKRLFKQYSG